MTMTWRIHILFPMLLWLFVVTRVDSSEQETWRRSGFDAKIQGRTIKGVVNNKSSRGAYTGSAETLLPKKQVAGEAKTMVSQVTATGLQNRQVHVIR